MSCYNGLVVCSIELTNKCNKSCWMCGRRKLETEYPQLTKFNKDISVQDARYVLDQLPKGTLVQFHNNGEPLMYPNLGEILRYRTDIIRCLDTNAKLLLKKAPEIINNLDTLTISVIENDPEADEQYEIVKHFLTTKGDNKPRMIYRLLGDISKREKEANKIRIWLKGYEKEQRWYNLPGLIATRILHKPEGSFGYTKETVIPEYGICLDLLSHLLIDVDGDVYPCVRFNPLKYNKLGNIKDMKLVDLWNGEKRAKLIEEHIKGNRACSELCKTCEYWGIPRGG